MRYVNPLVEGSSPSPVTKAQSTGNTQETLRNEGFSMRSRPETTLLSSRTETNENDAERPPATTEITTLPFSADPEFPVIAHNWTDLPAAIRQGIAAMVLSAVKRRSVE
jgi:hypothetical protein